MLTLLAVLALPMQTTAHQNQGGTATYHIRNEPSGWGQLYFQVPGHSSRPHVSPAKMIQWIRVYKNPKRIPVGEMTSPRDAAQSVEDWLDIDPLPLYDFQPHGIESGRYTYLLSSYHAGSPDPTKNNIAGTHWVPFNGETGELLEDPEKPGESGQVTATTHTSVGIGDIVAIAVNIKGVNANIISDLTIGPPEQQWQLNPNMPLWFANGSTGTWVSSHPPGDKTHTLVYQFEVTADHVAALNTEGTWLKRHWQSTSPNIFDSNIDTVNAAWPDLRYYEYVDWLWDDPGQWVPWPVTSATTLVARQPPDTVVSPFNTFVAEPGSHPRWKNSWGQQFLSGWGATTLITPNVENAQEPRDIRAQPIGAMHRHIPMFDPANPPDPETGGPIYYPKIEAPGSRASTTLSNVPEGTQTGEFTVTLRFADGPIFEGHDLSDAKIAAFKDKLTAALEDAGWTVEALAVEEEKRPRIASSGVAGPTSPSAFTEYQLTLSPSLGVKGAFPLQIPENVVMDAGENGNFASESVTVSVDTELKLAAGKTVEIPAPESGAYLAGDVIEVLVPFAQDGLTYAGDNPPYLTIYLGEAARHATWQQGEESAGSTVVPFRYTIGRDDPIAESVRVGDEGLSIPTGTTLMNGAGLSRVGEDPMPKGSGEAPESSPPKPMAERVQILTPAGAPLPTSQTESQVTVLPTPPVYLPPDDSAPKAGMSSIPRSPIVFNELGNGSGDTNDWLELRNVTGDAVSLKDWELSVVADGKKEDTSLIVFTTDVSVPAEGLLLITNSDPTADGNLLAGGDDITTAKAEVKGSSHLYLVNAGLSLPDDGQFLLILRNAKEKLGLNEAFVDVAGGGGSGTDAFVREQEGDYDTYVWPLQVLEAPGSATEDALSSGKVWLRAKADIVGYHRDAWAEAAFTGVGYDRKVTKSAETAGTPGYPNGAVKTEAPTPRGAITISEVMLDSAGGTLPQWVELYNSSKTDALNINRWELEIQNVADSEDLVGRPVVRLTLQEKIIQPNQTLLIVTGNARASSENVFPADRVYNLLELHDKNLRIKKPSDTFLSAKGFYLRLTDRNENVVDEVGNTDGNRRTDDTPAWALPVPLSEVEGMRSSLIRRYDKGVARDGKEKSSWALAANFAKFKAAELHYGHADDIGTPGYRQGGALPVELSSFTVARVESGSVIVTWTTESEVDNAGFNLRRSLTRDSGFTLLNPVLIAGAGTTGERQTYTFIDTSAKPGVEHYYQIEEVSFGGKAETLVTRRLRGPVSPAHRALKTLGEVKQAK